MRPRPTGPPVTLAALVALLVAIPALGAATPSPRLFPGPDGVVYAWIPDRGLLEPIELPWLAGLAVRDAAVSGPDRVLILPAGSREGDRRAGRIGWLQVVSLNRAGRPAAPQGRIEFEGEGLRLLAGPGSTAWVLAHRHGRDTLEGGEYWVHRIDLIAGRVSASAVLPGPAASLAAAPGGTRLFVGLRDRILTLSTVPRLAVSWHYRSPGANSGLALRPGTGVLYAARGEHVAVFDPDAIAGRDQEERRATEDDATAVVPIPFEATAILFSDDGRIAAAWGAGSSVALIDAEAAGAAGLPAFEPPPGAERALPLAFPGGTGLAVATFPGAGVVTLPLPPPAVAATRPPDPPPAPPAAPSEPPSPSRPAAPPEPPAPSEPPESSAPPVPIPGPLPAPVRSLPVPRPLTADVLRGRIEGDLAAVEAVVVYGPDSIVREQARAAPATDGAWEVPLPPPGAYRVVLLAKGTRALRSVPNFHTLQVTNEGVGGIDFSVAVAGP